MQVKLKGISKRGKDRINEHGETFQLIDSKTKNFTDSNKKGNDILVQSLNNTWRGQKWLGWLEIGRDVEIIN